MLELSEVFSKRAPTINDVVPESGRAHAEAVRFRGAAARRHAESIRKTSEAFRESGARVGELTAGYLALSSAIVPSNRAATLDFFRRGAELAEQIADAAEMFAGYLEAAAERGDRERRLELAAAEREIAALERRNAKRLREGRTGPRELERIPRLPRHGSGEQTPPVDSSSAGVPGCRGDSGEMAER